MECTRCACNMIYEGVQRGSRGGPEGIYEPTRRVSEYLRFGPLQEEELARKAESMSLKRSERDDE
eukprot:9251149-Pyramimonas_sp.AAC.1